MKKKNVSRKLSGHRRLSTALLSNRPRAPLMHTAIGTSHAPGQPIVAPQNPKVLLPIRRMIIASAIAIGTASAAFAQNPTPASPKLFDTLYPRNGDSLLETDQKILAHETEQTLTSGNDTTSTSATGANWVALTAHAAKHVTVFNTTGTTISIRYGTGAAVTLPTGQLFTFTGLSDASGLQIQRTDVSNTQVSVNFNFVNW